MKKDSLVVALLAGLAIIISVSRFSQSPGIDFYQYWGVIKARQWSHALLKSPAAEQEKYAEFLNNHATLASDKRVREANKIRNEFRFQLNQTPLCYSLFTLLPADYSLAFGIFVIIQTSLFLSAMVILSAVHYGNWLKLLSFALFFLILYGPVKTDLSVGNLNCFYLFGFSLLLVLADRVLGKRSIPPSIGCSIAFMGLLVFLALLKPNWNLVILLFVAYLWAVQGPMVFARSVLTGVVFGIFLMLLPCIQFDSWSIWQDWYGYFRSWNAASLKAIAYQGNYAPVLLISQVLGSSLVSAMTVIFASLIVSILTALARAVANRGLLVRGMAHKR